MSQNGDAWQRLEEMFATAADLPVEERGAYLDAECGDDAELRREVESLLEADVGSARFNQLMVAAIGEEAAAAGGADSPAAGRRIGAYEVTGVLGRGGMGAVYGAVRADDEYRKDVAIKLIRLGVDDPDVRNRFLTERQILASLDHPNIARLLDGGTTEDGLPYVVMERVDGEPIDDYCDSRTLSIDDRLRLFRRVCDAVQFAHRSLVVHRDIKPSNIMVTSEGVPKLLDFGIAKLLDAPAGAPVTRTTARVMTPEYASPEQVRGEPITTASDVYSLGVLLYELLTGRRPYRVATPTPAEIERAISEEAPERPSVVVTRPPATDAGTEGAPDGAGPEPAARARRTTPERLRRRLRGDLDNILLMALRKEPARRYASVEALSEDIRRHLEGLPVSAQTDTLGYRAGKFVRRHRAGVLGAAAALIIVIALTAFYTVRLAAERDRAQAEAAKAERVAGFLTGLFEAADPYQARGRELTAGELLDAGAERIERELADQPELRATMMGVIGDVYQSLGLFEKAEPFKEGALELRRADAGGDPLARADALESVADLASVMGEYARAESLLVEVLSIRRDEGGPNADLVATLDLLGVLAFNQHDYERSDSILKEAIELGRRLPADSVSIAKLTWALADRGRTRSRQAEHAEAEALLREALRLARQHLGEDYPGVGNHLDALAETLRLQGKSQEAVDMFREAVAHAERVFGADHPTTTTRLNNLALALQDVDEQQEAMAILEHVLERNRRTYGPDHPKVASALNNLALSHVMKGELDEGERLYLESLEIKRKNFGEVSSDVATTLNNIAHVAADRRDFTAALDYQRQALTIDRETLGDDHPYVGQDLVLIGIFLLGDGQVAEAGEPLREGTEIERRALGPDHRGVAEGLHNLARYLLANGELLAAEDTVREALRIRREAMGPDNWVTALSETLLGEILAASGRQAEAEPLLVNGYEVVRAGTPENSRHRELARGRLVEFLRARGEMERAAAVPP